jgi:hypothetical protein
MITVDTGNAFVLDLMSAIMATPTNDGQSTLDKLSWCRGEYHQHLKICGFCVGRFPKFSTEGGMIVKNYPVDVVV